MRALAPCGTEAAYRRHLRRGEVTCPACCAAHTAAERVRRTGTAQPRELVPCPSDAAYTRHRRRGEQPCVGCRVAHAEYVRTQGQGDGAAA